MIRREAVDEHGLPSAHFFIWVDDVEYTGRILREGAGYMVPESIAWHWTPEAHDTLSDKRGLFYYRVRNELWLLRGSSFQKLERVPIIVAYLRALITYLRRNPSKMRALRTIARGLRDGMRGDPR
jgi:GT2 family glycosyltransferase